MLLYCTLSLCSVSTGYILYITTLDNRHCHNIDCHTLYCYILHCALPHCNMPIKNCSLAMHTMYTSSYHTAQCIMAMLHTARTLQPAIPPSSSIANLGTKVVKSVDRYAHTLTQVSYLGHLNLFQVKSGPPRGTRIGMHYS